MKRWIWIALTLLFAIPVPGSHGLEGQSSLGVGLALPTGDLKDSHDSGYTVRGQLGLSLILASLHLQAGWSRFPAETVSAEGLPPDIFIEVPEDANVYHAGVGGRLGLGFFWIGANAAYFFGDGKDGVGFLPEVGFNILMLEAVADYRLDGDAHWIGARVGVRF